MTDDWGTPLGADPDPAPKGKPVKKGTVAELVGYFTDNLPRDYYGRLNAPVNGGALTTGIKKLLTAGKTPDEIREMMRTFLVEIHRKPLPVHVAPWRGFLANLDRLANQPAPQKAQDYDNIKVDQRFSSTTLADGEDTDL